MIRKLCQIVWNAAHQNIRANLRPESWQKEGISMTDHEANAGNVASLKPLRQSRRDRWATPVAAAITSAHIFAGLFVIGWYYFLVPRRKFELDELAFRAVSVISDLAIAVIMQSDVIVNYWYLPAIVGLPVVIADFLVMRWVAKQLGLSKAVLCGIGITMLILLNYVYGNYVIVGELSRLRVIANSPTSAEAGIDHRPMDRPLESSKKSH